MLTMTNPQAFIYLHIHMQSNIKEILRTEEKVFKERKFLKRLETPT